ncbi:hypothetical protein EAJ19_23415 [Escherichia coli]|nr:hypothetical protein B2H83_27185 [Escherichia coli M8]RYT02918.1 hypothetical protein EAJ19_23415 [Escherichia coli]
MYRELLMSLILHARDNMEKIIYLTLSATDLMHLNNIGMKLLCVEKMKRQVKKQLFRELLW